MFKRTIRLLTLAVMMFVGGNATAQITEINSVPNHLTYSEYDQSILYNYNLHKSCYDGNCSGDLVLSFYDTDLSIVKSVDFTSIFSSMLEESEANINDVDVLCVGKNLYTNSGKYEFILLGTLNSTGLRVCGIYNEDGELVFALPEIYWNNSYNLPFPFIKDGKLFIHTYDTVGYNDHNDPITEPVTKSYNLAGSNASNITAIPLANSSKLYPNPARQSVTLEYDIQGQMKEMQIVDMQGRVVANYLLDPSQKQVKINTSNYKKGVYIYRYGNNSGKFVVE